MRTVYHIIDLWDTICFFNWIQQQLVVVFWIRTAVSKRGDAFGLKIVPFLARNTSEIWGEKSWYYCLSLDERKGKETLSGIALQKKWKIPTFWTKEWLKVRFELSGECHSVDSAWYSCCLLFTDTWFIVTVVLASVCGTLLLVLCLCCICFCRRR